MSAQPYRAVTDPDDGYYVLAATLWGTPVGRPEWQEDAACRRETSIDWFQDEQYATEKHRLACAKCPVLDECRDDVLAWERRIAVTRKSGNLIAERIVGFAAGMTPDQRRQHLRQALRAENRRMASNNAA